MPDRDSQQIIHFGGGHTTVSQGGVQIRHKGKPVDSLDSVVGHVYLVVDCSGSMAEDKLIQAKSGALNFAKDALSKGYLTGLIQFHSFVTHLCEPQRQVDRLKQYLDKIRIGESTYMGKAIHLAHQKLKGMMGNRVMVIVTDGMPNGPGDPEASLNAGKRAKNDGIDIITIGTDDADQSFLKKLASRKELGIKVSREKLQQAIISTANMLPPPKQNKT